MKHFAAIVALVAGLVPGTAISAQEAPDGQRRARDLATCAAYFYNATNARPIGQYELLYGAGEDAMNGALRLLPRGDVDELVATASTAMNALTGSDWRNFHRVEARYGAACDALLGVRTMTSDGR